MTSAEGTADTPGAAAEGRAAGGATAGSGTPGRSGAARRGGGARPSPSGAAGTSATTASTAAARPAGPGEEFFIQQARAYAAGRAGQRLAILTAGAVTAGDLGTSELQAGGTAVTVSLIDDDQPVTRAAAAASPGAFVLGDLRSVPLPPRSYDIVHCPALLPRISHTELVLDRLVSALKPGGLLLLRFCDGRSAAGFLDRRLPRLARRAIWRRRWPGQPGPHPAVYEPLVSARGVQAYAQLRGMVINQRLALGGLAGGLPPGPAGYLAAQKFLARLSRGRLTAAHEELLYALCKPEDRFARLL